MTKQELELPKGWAKTSLDCILETLEAGKRPKGGVKKSTKGIPSLGGEHLNSEGNFNFQKLKFVPLEFFESMSQGHIKFDDVLIVKDGATTGKVSFVRKDFPYSKAAVNEHVFILRANPSAISQLFLFYYLFSTTGQKLIRKKSSGLIGGINTSFVNEFYIPICPLNEQKRIVTKIEGLFSKIDSTKQSLVHTKLQLVQYRHSLLKSVFEGNHTEKWHETTLENITTSIGDGIHSTPKYTENSEFYFINGNNLRNGSITITAKTKMVEQSEFEKYKVNLNENTVLLSINGTIGNLAFYKNEKVILGKSACYINTGENLDPSFLFYLLQSNSIKSYFRNNLTSTTIYNLSLKAIRMTPIVLPTLTIQKQIVSQIEQGFSLIENSQRIVNSTLQTLETMRMSVLKQAFEGKLVTQDPNDEPASILLEKICNKTGS